MKVLMIGPANLGPYHFARFRAIVKLLPEFTYIRISAKEFYRPWSSDLDYAPCRIVSLKRGESIAQLLEKERPNFMMVIGYNHRTLLRAACWAKRHGVPCILQSDSTYRDNPRHWWKELAKSLIVRCLFDGAFVAGIRSASYVKSLGIAEKLIWQGVDVVDNQHFAVSSKVYQPPDRFPNNYFLTVARLSPEKNLHSLLSAFEIYRHRGGQWALVIVGTGPSKQVLKKSVPPDLAGSLYWYGWASYNDLPALYHGASCFILPSIKEPWGLVVNEAMAAGLPVLVSENCGCLPELCHWGVNGFGFEPLDVEQLAKLMLKMSSGQVDLDVMGEESKRIIRDYTPETWARTVIEMAGSPLAHK